MNKQSDDEIRDSIIGLGEKSVKKSYYPQLQKKIQEINELNKSLEDKVKERTFELERTNDKLEQTIINLKLTQNKLIESEKMASLGALVAGVAHEINTPIGISLTGITHFLGISEEIKEHYESSKMTQKEFENFLNKSVELASLININLDKTVQLIRSFKQISVDQTSEEKREFNIKKYFKEILLSINNIINRTKIEVEIQCNDNINITSYPGAYSQIFTNLILNSIIHGYKEKQKGKITIDIHKEDNELIFNYTDDGSGIKKENLSKIFDPFFTTNREKGGTGLGLNIIYNIVTNNLKGNIICHSDEKEGVLFKISIPLDTKDQNNHIFHI